MLKHPEQTTRRIEQFLKNTLQHRLLVDRKLLDTSFAPGDFAYVPVLSASSHPFGDTGATVENEIYKWGTNVTGYLLFGYGSRTHANREFEDSQREFVDMGLPGYGAAGVDTVYENYVLQLFEGAIYFSKNY